MKRFSGKLFGALAGCLLVPAAGSAQTQGDNNFLQDLLPSRTGAVSGKPVSPYNPNLVQPGSAAAASKPVILQAGWFDGNFQPTPLPGLRMLFQGSNTPAPNFGPTGNYGNTNANYVSQELLPRPQQVPQQPAQMPIGPAIGSDGQPLPQQGIVTAPGTGMPATTAPQQGYVPYNAYPVTAPDGGILYQPGTVQQGIVQQGTVSGSTRGSLLPQKGFIAKKKSSFLQEVMGVDDPTNLPSDPAGINGYPAAGRFWIGAEYAWIWNKGMHVPPLVTSSPAGQQVTTAGTLNNANTAILYGNSNLFTDGQSGVRLHGGFWFDPCNKCGIDFSVLVSPTRSNSFLAANTGDPGLFRPFLNPLTGTQFAELVSYRDPATGLGPVVAGAVTVRSTNEFWTGDVNYRQNLCTGACSRLDLLVGYKFFQLNEGISILENLTATDPAGVRAPLGTQFTVLDSFKTHNDFNGAQIGLAGETRLGNWFLGYTAKIAAGDMHSEVDITGNTIAQIPGQSKILGTGGLLALPSNIGHYTQDKFAYVPDVGLTLGYQICKSARIYAGYNFMYASTVQRPGDQIDLVVNPTQIPPGSLQGIARPVYLNHSTDYWMQTISVGFELRF